MKTWIKSYLSFTRREQRGILVLISLLMLMIVIYPVVPLLMPGNPGEKAVILDSLAVLLENHVMEDSALSGIKNKTTIFITPPGATFDPNELEEKDWTAMGFDQKLAHTIINYRNKGGFFRKKEDLRKIFGMTEDAYKRIEPWIAIRNPSAGGPAHSMDTTRWATTANTAKSVNFTDTVMVDLNSADTAELMKLKGIGRYYAGKIIRYRERLGGFICKEQLLEIEGIDSARFELLGRQAWADTALVRRLDLNSSAFKDFLHHPYFEYHMVKAIFQYRDEHGSYRSVEDLRQIPLFHEKLFMKIAPYLEASGF